MRSEWPDAPDRPAYLLGLTLVGVSGLLVGLVAGVCLGARVAS